MTISDGRVRRRFDSRPTHGFLSRVYLQSVITGEEGRGGERFGGEGSAPPDSWFIVQSTDLIDSAARYPYENSQYGKWAIQIFFEPKGQN